MLKKESSLGYVNKLARESEKMLRATLRIAVAMVCDWIIRAVIFIWRQKSGKWKEFEVV